uniref:Odorant binding protein 24 n=1 Tax=Colaphellus bowringi TaxID=561076 RepID=A0A0S3J3B3_9CUCU|nr:odorant binding protein 24 [Colaphellus bowringi]
MNVHAGLQKPNGDIDKDDLRRALSEGIRDVITVDDIVDDCGQRVGSTAEEASVNLFRCIFGHSNAYVHEWKPSMLRQTSGAEGFFTSSLVLSVILATLSVRLI